MKQYNAIWVASIAFLVFLACGLAFVSTVRRKNEAQISAYLEDATGQRRTAVQQQIEGDFQVMRGVAVALGEMDIRDTARVSSILETINQGNTFVRMGLAGLDGRVDLVDLSGSTLHDMELAELRAFRQALRGYDAVSPVFYEEASGRFVQYYAVPVFQRGTVVAVLCAVNGEDVLADVLAVPVFQGTGRFCMINKSGSIVVPAPGATPAMEIGTSIFDIATLPEAERAEMERALAFDEGGHFVFDMNRVEQLCVLLPLFVNDWFLFSVVPHDEINTYYNETFVGIIIIIVVASLVFLFLLFWQLKIMANNQKDLEQLAYVDSLTGMRNYNRLMLDAEKLQQAHAGETLAVWSLDIKQFKTVNDIFGIKTGDLLLEQVSSHLLLYEPENALACRIGADQFAGILVYSGREALADLFMETFSSLPLEEVVPDEQMKVDFAVGIYWIDDFQETIPIEEMINRASIAKQAAKRVAGTEVLFFSQEMGWKLHRNAELEAASRHALTTGEFQFFLQPKVGIQGRPHMAGAEALARWKHPVHGFISPEEFIPLFESNGFIVELDRYIFEEVCKWLERALEMDLPGICIAVNVSRQGLFREDFLSYYTAVKQRYHIPDRQIELEFTESLVATEYTRFHNLVQALQQAGFICSIDDFGAGYSSLNVLKNLPIDVLKLDAVFFRDSFDRGRAQLVIASFLHMAGALSIKTVAEGVESLDQVEFLQVAGCDVVQGYYFSRPLPLEEFVAFWEAHKDGFVMEE